MQYPQYALRLLYKMNQPETKLNVHDNIWYFSVSDPELHNKKFTIYKVTCKTFPIKSPEVLTEIVCWKRYNDFKTLYKSLYALHKALHRRNPFPEFAKPKLFGRFDDTVIEERRQSALDLLNFVSGQPHLYKSLIFKQFFEDGKSKVNESDKLSPLGLESSSTLDVLSGEMGPSDGKPPPDLVPIIAHPGGSKVLVDRELVSVAATEGEDKEADQSGEKTSSVDYRLSEVIGLEGTWNFPQEADNISLGSSSGEETIDTDEDSVMAQSLPDPELALFDPMAACKGLRSPSEGQEPHLTRSNSWLLSGLNLCAEMETDGLDETDKGERDKEDECKDVRSNTDFSDSSTLVGDPSQSGTMQGEVENEDVTEPGPLDDLDEFDPLRKMSVSSVTSKIECGKGDLDLSGQWQDMKLGSFSSQASSSSQRVHISTSSDANGRVQFGAKNQSSASIRSQSFVSVKSQNTDSSNRNNSTSSKGLLQKLISKSPSRRSRAMTDQSVSTMDLGGKEDYIYLAASQISMAQNSEANGDFEVAFAYYKSGVGILLQGVQTDSNKGRRDAVRRKTAQYLMKAEDLFNRHLASEDVSERRWGVSSYLSPSLDLDPSLTFIRGSLKELRNFQVLGVLDKVILTRDKATDETFVIKSIPKSPASDSNRLPSIFPTSCPFMVSLHKFYETDNSVYLLLQYANGGKLWTYVGDFLSSEHSTQAGVQLNFEAEKEENKNIYSGCKPEDESPVSRDPSPGTADNLNGTETCLARILTKEAAKQVEELGGVVQSSQTSGAIRFSQVKSGDQEEQESGTDDLVENEKLPDAEHEKEPLARQLSSFSDDSSHLVYDTDTSFYSPSSLHDEDHFQNLLQEHRKTLEGFSINSFDSEETRRLSSACFDRIGSIAEDKEPPLDTSSHSDRLTCLERSEVKRQHSEDEVFLSQDSKKPTSAFDPQDILKSSKKLLEDVEKVLHEEHNPKILNKETKTPSSSENSTVENLHSQASSEVEEPSIYDLNRSSEEDSSDPSISERRNKILSFKANDPTCANPATEKKPATHRERSSFSESDSINHQHLNSTTCHVFRQTSTPHKLSITRMNSKEMTRSASFECDLRSPTRNKARTVTDLFEHLDSQNQEQVCLPESSIRKWMANIVTAVSRLHSLGIICRDLKPSNILLADGGTVYLSYFCRLGHGDQELDWEAVNDLYAAPEVRSIGGFNMSCDWWSIGALLYELVIGRSLRECHPGGINSHTCLHIPSFVSDEARSLLEGLLVFNPKERLGSGMAGSEEIKAHPFFNGVDWHSLESS